MNSTAIRGSALTLTGNLFTNPMVACLRFEEDPIIVMQNSLIVKFGPQQKSNPKWQAGLPFNTTQTY
ncbi:MAG: hypothetical protein ACI8V0_002977 [Pseudohongiellaceae bacterium]|jgi:hypothetical protein